MYCSQCGQKAVGKFCAQCGAPLGAGVALVEPQIVWEEEHRYEQLVQLPAIRDQIERHAALAPKGMTGEQFLAICDKLIPMGVPMENLVTLIQPLGAQLGIRTGQERAGHFAVPIGRMMVRVLCALARGGQSLRGVRQANDGCQLDAVLPSDLLSLAGDLTVSVTRYNASGTTVRAATRINGQFFDWGKSRRALDRLFQELQTDAA